MNIKFIDNVIKKEDRIKLSEDVRKLMLDNLRNS